MAKPRKQFDSPAEARAHAARLKKRSERHARAVRERKMEKAASEAAEGEADFEQLVEVERIRLGAIEKQQSKAAKHSPKTITAARENLTLAFDLMGGVPALVVWGRQNPTEFYRLWARLIPKESVEVTAQLPLESLLAKLSSRDSMSVAEAAYAVGTDVLDAARVRVIEHQQQNPDEPDPYEDDAEDSI